MSYYTRQDIPVHYLLADAFTICDQYHCSVLGPTLPNRLYWLTATLDPDGLQGGPELESPAIEPTQKFSWRIMLQNLSDAGVSWKVYHNNNLGPYVSSVLNYGGFVQYFKQSADPRSDLARFGITPSYRRDCAADVKAKAAAGFLVDSGPPRFRTSRIATGGRRCRDCERAKDFAFQSCGLGKDRADRQL
jgi:phospholipase C